MMVYLIRHGATRGNLERRYVGKTDEGLCGIGREALFGRDWPAVERVAASPMKRCLETARLVYPGHEPLIVPGFRECDFGEFEYKSSEQLAQDARYQHWIDSGGELPFPGGEGKEAFMERVVCAFEELMAGQRADSLAIVAHGGTAMAILARYGLPERGYFDTRLSCGGLISARWQGGHLHL